TRSENEAIAIADQLSSGRWTHDFPITPEHAAEIDLNVSTKMPEEIMSLMDLFPDTVKRRPSVHYVAANAKGGSTSQAAGAVTIAQPGMGVRSFSSGPWAGAPRSNPPSDK